MVPEEALQAAEGGEQPKVLSSYDSMNHNNDQRVETSL